MKEIEKIKEYIDKNNKKIAIELYDQGFLIENPITIIDEENSCLIVYENLPFAENEVFRICESWLKVPNAKKLNKIVKDWEKDVCHHWAVRKLGKYEILVISFLSVENYLKAVELYNTES